LHASTQCDNRSVEKVKFLQEVGFEQVVLARELSLPQIKEIADNTSVRLEAFIHGALCVSYSGQCYAGAALASRSANRGVCPQICRLPFDLQDAKGHSLGTRHWLSLKDFNQTENLSNLIEAGVSSFKIEGRLKDLDYVKNTVAWYSRLLDAYIQSHPDYCRASEGSSRISFEPDLEKTFYRGGTDYFCNGRHSGIACPQSPKSIGKRIGTVQQILANALTVNTNIDLHNGDGLCYFTPQGGLQGFRVNRVEGNRVFPSEMPVIQPNTVLYRNEDRLFSQQLSANTATRKIGIHIQLENDLLTLFDGKNKVSVKVENDGQSALKDPTENCVQQLCKLGDSCYEASSCQVSTPLFLPSSHLAEARRKAVDMLNQQRLANLPQPSCLALCNNYPYPSPSLNYRGNVHNQLAENFYKRHGVKQIAPSYEKEPPQGVPVMYCKHCIRYELGACPSQGGKVLNEPLFLIYKNYYLRLAFDCKNCEMQVIKQ